MKRIFRFMKELLYWIWTIILMACLPISCGARESGAGKFAALYMLISLVVIGVHAVWKSSADSKGE